ncbi:hypothetical protein [Sinorhizobium arboris]|uniref:hypothetical protein n=1 Tax=Sinorhizobium arboris TaxID=76745 RepID=UPI0004040FB2|nr:hypothetical protein [Sinorhizobium arboris]
MRAGADVDELTPTPLIYAHINPYGAFDLDLARRIDFDGNRPIGTACQIAP